MSYTDLMPEETVGLKLRRRDGRASWHEVPADETAVAGLVITAFYELGPRDQLLPRPGCFALAHVPTGRFVPLSGEITNPRLLQFMARLIAGLGWDDWSQWSCPAQVPAEIPEVVALAQREAAIAENRGQL